ncbi:MAG TPA: LAGLIDADG family homing endonuclease [Blastocatellia bacterium]|nr:LAGLIDADG family homing endonuclease [Blastocatellia bacterium]
MIVPFEERLVREVEGRRIISAGLSSYGYDIRLAKDGFYIFSPIKGREIDPKNFDSDSLIEAPLRTAEDGSQYWLLPPLSYALGVTVETFNIPRKVIGLCFGKCLSGDTRVLDVQTGRWIPLRSFVEEKTGTTATLSPQGVTPGRVTRHLCTGIKPVFELTTQSGRKIRATARHPFLTPWGWMELRSLLPRDPIAVPACLPFFGQRTLSESEIHFLALTCGRSLLGEKPLQARSVIDRPGQHPLHQDMRAIYSAIPHASLMNAVHRDCLSGWEVFPPFDLSAFDGSLWHGQDSLVGEHIPDCIFMATKECLARFLRTLFSVAGKVCLSDDGSPTIELSSSSESLLRDIQHLLLRFGVLARLAQDRYRSNERSLTLSVFDEDAVAAFGQNIGFMAGTKKAQFLTRWTTSRKNRLSSDHLIHAVRFPPLVWDTVESITPRGSEPVYDLTVLGTHNFIANDLVVHNSTYARSGVIVNATPLEPTWRGRLVLEISNSADLPVRIYAEEGIAQVVFFESDEECLTAYEDRQGKYQDQKGLVTPKV